MTKLQQAAIAAKADGYKHMTSVVKSVFRTTYYHVVDIDVVASTGEWPAAPRGNYPAATGGSWHGRAGTTNVPPRSIGKREAIARYCK